MNGKTKSSIIALRRQEREANRPYRGSKRRSVARDAKGKPTAFQVNQGPRKKAPWLLADLMRAKAKH